LSVDDQPATVLSVADGKITFLLPAGLGAGAAVLRMTVGGQALAPVVLGIDPPPPVVLAVLGVSETPVSASRPAIPGELLRVILAGLADDAAVKAPGRVRVQVDGIEHTAARVIPSAADPNVHEVHFTLSPNIPSGEQPVTVRVGYRLSRTVTIPVQPVMPVR
jgi:uncharacterized protein (TIGR03437 family)